MSNNECPICYDNENEIEQNIKLECGHKFHDKCILEWCKNSLSCPMCRCNITDERCVEIRIISLTSGGRSLRETH